MAKQLKFGNGEWYGADGSILAYNDLNDNYKPLPFNFERGSSATRVNKEGLIELVGGNQPRIDYLDSEDGVFLLENAATNVIINSEDFTGSEWGLFGFASGDAPILTSNYATSPDGKQNATRLQFNLNGGTTTTDRSYIRYTSFTSQTDYYYSCYVKSANGQEQKLLWQHGGDDNEFTVNDEWQRVELDRNGNAETFAGFSLRGGISSVDYADVLIWGFQVERNSVASSYIPTQGSIQNRLAETANGSGNSGVFNDSEGVLFANIASNSNDGLNRYITISDGSTSNRVALRIDTDNKIGGFVTDGTSQASFRYEINTLNFSKVAIKYKTNDFSLFVNGFEVLTDLNGSTPSGLNVINYRDSISGDDFYGKTKQLQYFDTALTDSELETLTSWVSFQDMAEGQLYTIE
jgi:hypothetical protein